MNDNPKRIKLPKTHFDRRIRTQRDWKKLKRSELKAARKALRDFSKGCVYTPSPICIWKGESACIGQALRTVDKLILACSVEIWGR